MNLDYIFPTFENEMTSVRIKEITTDDKQTAYNLIYENYMYYYNSLGTKPSNFNDYFSWISKSLDLNLIYFNKDNSVKTLFFFSKSEGPGTLYLHDLTTIQFNYEILQLQEPEFMSYLINEKHIPHIPEKIIKTGIGTFGNMLRFAGQALFEREYLFNFKPQLQPIFETVSFNSLRIHKDVYDFSAMTKEINNGQFTLELNECLNAYEMERFFVGAAGLGSVLEHLLYLSIEKHVPPGSINTNANSTASEYIAQLKKEPFSISKREVSNLKNIFAYRNSVSHFNKGFFSKEMCDHLLAGMKYCFDTYYMFNNARNINLPN